MPEFIDLDDFLKEQESKMPTNDELLGPGNPNNLTNKVLEEEHKEAFDSLRKRIREMLRQDTAALQRIEDRHAVRKLILRMGDDPNRDGLKDTPERVLRAYDELFAGYKTGVKELFKTFSGAYDQMIVVKDIEFLSFCEHHLLPFEGVAHVGYVPGRIYPPEIDPQGEHVEAEPVFQIIGLSKIARIVDVYAKRLQIQERLTDQITSAFTDHLPSALGSACVIEAKHACMGCRGVKKPTARMITSSLTGVFMFKPEVRAEFFACTRS